MQQFFYPVFCPVVVVSQVLSSSLCVTLNPGVMVDWTDSLITIQQTSYTENKLKKNEQSLLVCERLLMIGYWVKNHIEQNTSVVGQC